MFRLPFSSPFCFSFLLSLSLVFLFTISLSLPFVISQAGYGDDCSEEMCESPYTCDPQSHLCEGSDPGTCNPACQGSEVCTGGICTPSGPSCMFPETLCGFTCVDVTSDPDNCNGCGELCSSPQTQCIDSMCSCPLSDPTYCSSQGICSDTTSDSANCGACGFSCGANGYCANSVCVCYSPFATCGMNPTGGCLTDTSSDNNYCGSCDIECGGDQQCTDGECVELCLVNGIQADFTSDINNCGSCGFICDNDNSESCTNSECVCHSNYATCKGDSGGCTTEIDNDPENCGSCHSTCSAPLTFCFDGICSSQQNKICRGPPLQKQPAE